MSFALLFLFVFCSCCALANPSLWYLPAISYWIWALKHSTDAFQHIYMYRTSLLFVAAFGFRAIYHRSDPNFTAFAIYAVVYVIIFYVSFRHVRSVETYKAPDEDPEQEDDSDA